MWIFFSTSDKQAPANLQKICQHIFFFDQFWVLNGHWRETFSIVFLCQEKIKWKILTQTSCLSDLFNIQIIISIKILLLFTINYYFSILVLESVSPISSNVTHTHSFSHTLIQTLNVYQEHL